MALAYDNSVSGTFSSVSTKSLTLTIGVNSPILIATVSINALGTRSVSNITIGAYSFVKITGISNNSSFFDSVELWYLASPPTGSQTVVFNFSGSSSGTVGIISLTGAKGTIGSSNTASGTGSSASASLTTTTDNSILVDVLELNTFWNPGVPSPSQSNTSRYSSTSGNSTGAASTKTTTSAGSYTDGWSWTQGSFADAYAYAVAEVIASEVNPSVTDSSAVTENLSVRINKNINKFEATTVTEGQALTSQTLQDSLIPIYGGTSSAGEANQQAGQSFVADGSNIYTVNLYVSKTGTPIDSLFVSITSTLGGIPLKTITVSPTGLANNSLQQLAFVDPVPVTKNNTYYIEISRGGVRDTSNYISLGYKGTTSSYSGGSLQQRDNLGWSSTSTADLTFRLAYDFDALNLSLNENINVSDSSTITDTVSADRRNAITVNDASTLSENISMSMADRGNVFDASVVTENIQMNVFQPLYPTGVQEHWGIRLWTP